MAKISEEIMKEHMEKSKEFFDKLNIPKKSERELMKEEHERMQEALRKNDARQKKAY